jgi:tetratricopeptide (TPR) repeat protein
VIVLASASVASADNKKVLARQLFELGIDEYKQKQYEAAAASMNKAYALDPIPETLYALAQSERMAGDCNGAIKHYEKLLDTAKDDQTVNAVKANLELCYQSSRGEQTKAEALDAKALERQNAPTIQIRTVYRTEQRSNTLAIAFYAIGGVAIGGAVTTFIVAQSASDDAKNATTLAQYNSLFDRAQTLRDTAYIAAGSGALLVGIATWRVLSGNKKSKTSDVAVVPIAGGSMVSWATTW